MNAIGLYKKMPKPYSELAIHNLKTQYRGTKNFRLVLTMKHNLLSEALEIFDWYNSPQTEHFWSKIYVELQRCNDDMSKINWPEI